MKVKTLAEQFLGTLLQKLSSHLIESLTSTCFSFIHLLQRPAFGDHFVCSLEDTKVEKSTLKPGVRWVASSVDIKKGALTREGMCDDFWRCLLLLLV